MLVPPAADEIAEFLRANDPDHRLPAQVLPQASSRLLLHLLTEIAATLDEDQVDAAATLGELYDLLLDTLAPEDNLPARAVLILLAAAGAGPNLPIRVASLATGRLGGPTEDGSLRDLLLHLGGIVSRSHAGTPQEQLGLFHLSLLEHVLARSDWVPRVADAHAAILDALDERAIAASVHPASGSDLDMSERIARYDAKHRPDHLWALGRHADAIRLVIDGLTHRAADNRNLLRTWAERGQQRIAPGRRDTDRARKPPRLLDRASRCPRSRDHSVRRRLGTARERARSRRSRARSAPAPASPT